MEQVVGRTTAQESLYLRQRRRSVFLWLALVLAGISLLLLASRPVTSAASARRLDQEPSGTGQPSANPVSLFSHAEQGRSAAPAPTAHKVVATIPLGLGIGIGANNVTVNPSTGLAYVTNGYSYDVSIISGTEVITMVVIGDGPSGPSYGPHAVATNPETGLVYVSVSYLFYGELVILSGTEVIASIETPCPPANIAANPVDGLVYTADSSCGTVTVLSGTGMLAQVPVGGYLLDLAVHPDTGLVYVADGNNDRVVVLSQTEVLTSVAVGNTPWDVDVEPASGWVYVTNAESDDVTILSGTAVLATVGVGHRPYHLRANPANGLVYVTNFSGGTVSVIAGQEVTATLYVGASPEDLGINGATGLVYVCSTFYLDYHVSIISGTGVISRANVPALSVAVNPTTGRAYVVGLGVTVLEGTSLVATIPPAPAPAELAVDSTNGLVYAPVPGDPARVFVISGTAVITSLVVPSSGPVRFNSFNGLVYIGGRGGVSTLSGTRVITTTPLPSLVIDMAVNSSTGLVYVVPYGAHQVAILSGTEVISTAVVEGGSPQALDVDPTTGLTYVAGGETLTVLSGTEYITTIGGPQNPFGAHDVAVNADTGLTYVTRGDDLIWILSGTEVMTGVEVGGSLQEVAVHPATGLVYVRDDWWNRVHVLRGTEVVAEVQVGDVAIGLAMHPTLAYAYVINEGDDTLAVLAGPALVETVGVGRMPMDAVVNPVNGYVYVANYADHSISVLEPTLPYRLYLPLLKEGAR